MLAIGCWWFGFVELNNIRGVPLKLKLMDKEGELSSLIKKTSKYISDYEMATEEIIRYLHNTRDEQVKAIVSQYAALEIQLVKERKLTHTTLTEFVEKTLDTELSELSKSRLRLEEKLRHNHQVDVIIGYRETLDELNLLINYKMPKLVLKSVKLNRKAQNRNLELRIISAEDVQIDCVGETSAVIPCSTQSLGDDSGWSQEQSPQHSAVNQFAGSVSRDSKGASSGSRDSNLLDYKHAEVMLHRVENPWKWGGGVQLGMTAEQRKEYRLLRRFRGFLNKITPQNFQKLVAQILEMELRTESELSGIMKLVYEKAIAEPLHSITYANLCQSLSKEFKVTSTAEPGAEVTFRKILLVRCQKEFEKSANDDAEKVVKRNALEQANGDEKTKLQKEFDLFVTQARRRKLGNISQ